MFTHLHTHSHYSLLNALPKIDDLVAEAKKHGMEALALTDTSNLYGAVEFYIKAKAAGIKPIIGVELYVAKDHLSKTTSMDDRPRHTIVLLAKNNTGYKNLLKLVSTAQLDGFYYKPRIDKNLLRKHHEGLIALSGNMTGEVPAHLIYDNTAAAKAAALEYREIFGDENFYLELGANTDYENQANINEGLYQIHLETNIPLVACADIFYLHPDDRETHDILLCIQNNWKVTDENRTKLTALDLSFRSPEEMSRLFRDFPSALENTEKIAASCEVEIHLGETQLPHFDVPDGTTPEAYLRHLCEVGLEKRYAGAPMTSAQKDRLEYELGIISKTGFASYFLIVADFVNWAKQQGVVVGPGRGSAAGSFVAYLTGITDLDPIVYDLLFERFLNPERISMPDVDMDFADDRRDEVLDYVRKKYGADHVAQIITFGTMAAKAAIRDTGRALGFPYSFCDQISKMIPMFASLGSALEEVPDLKKLYEENADAKRIIDTAKKLEGNVRHASVHACGVVVTKEPVVEYSPLQHVSGHGDGMVTQYSSSTKMSVVEKIGLLKMDFLGLKNLTIMQNTVRIIHGLGKFPELANTLGLDPEHASPSDIMDHIPLDDEATYALLQEGRTTGVFQLESSGMKRYLKQLKPTIFEDIIAMVALYRPGPMDYIPDFIDGKHGRKEVKYLHPKLEPILKTTYGVAVYQEQLMQIGRDLAGFSLGEADVLRKAVGKKIKELVAEQREKFISRCVDNGIQKKVAEKVFSFIEPFAGYGFNRSHAACYALIGYQTAYLKAHYPAEFMAALLTSDEHDTDRIAIEIEESKQMGIETLPPSVNESFEAFAVIPQEDGKERIRFGLNAIKNVGRPAALEIVRERKNGGPYKSLEDFLERVRSRDLNKKSIEALAKVGALEAFGERNLLLENIDAILLHSRNTERMRDTHQDSLFGGMTLEAPKVRMKDARESTKKERLGWEKELLGLYVSDHPLTEYADYLAEAVTPIKSLAQLADDAPVRVGGIIAAAKKIYAKNGSEMFFATLEDRSGRIELIVFPRVAAQTEAFWKEDEIVLVNGRLNRKDGDGKILVDSVQKLDQEEVGRYQSLQATRKKQSHERAQREERKEVKEHRLILTLDAEEAEHVIPQVAAVLQSAGKGATRVLVSLGEKRIQTDFLVACDEPLLRSLRAVPGIRNIVEQTP